MSYSFFEVRPVYCGEVVTISATIDGDGDISSWTFTGQLFDPAGDEVTTVDTVTVEIADGASRLLTVIVAGQESPGTYRVIVFRTDDDSGLVVLKGDLEITDATKRNNR